MTNIEKSIEVNKPLTMVYNQWTQFEEYPRFMEGVREVKQIDDNHLHWSATIAGKEVEWDAEITDQIPDQRVAWRSMAGAENSGVVTFEATGPTTTRVTLNLNYEPHGAVQKIGDALGVVSGRVQGDLQRFKDFIESTPVETGAWRGEIH